MSPAFLIGTALIVAAFSAAVFLVGDSQSLPTGTVLRAEGDERVYYIENDKKRWVPTAGVFKAHGFSWEAVRMVPREVLSAVPEGEVVTAQSQITLPGEQPSLPDLVPFAAEDSHLVTTKNGRTTLRFSGNFWNQGGGVLEVVADPAAERLSVDAIQDVYQRIRGSGNIERFRLAGQFLWHAAHGHYHLTDVMNYTLAPINAPGAVSVRKEKVTFCMRDDRSVNLSLPGALSRTYMTCGRERQGVSPGWADVYRYTLPDQFIDVHDIPAGVYGLWFDVNPKRQLIEQRTDNNRSVMILRIDPRQGILEVLATAAPFPGGSSFPDGALLRADNDERVAVISHNRKRFLPSLGLVERYRSNTRTIDVLPPAIIEAIPFNNLIQASDSPTVYALNDAGYRRLIRSAEIFASYGFRWEDVTVVDAAELAAYPESDLVQQAGSGEMWRISGNSRRLLIDTKNISFKAVHSINAFDLDSYVIGAAR